jgi:hypothetical protein
MTKARINPGHGGRLVAEWIGKMPDSKPPAYVLLRIFRRAKGMCHISNRKIMPGDKWQAEHIVALHAGGENRESNLAPALIDAHKIKTAEELAIKAKTDRVAKKHAGIARPAAKIKSAGFAPSPEKERSDRQGRIDKSALPKLARRICGVLIE